MPQTYSIVSASERVIIPLERSRTSSGGSRSARSPPSSSGSRSYHSGSGSGGSESWCEINPYGEEDEIEPSDSASRARLPSSRQRETESRPAPRRRHSSRRSVLREEVEPEDEPPRRHDSSRRHHSSRSSRHRHGESRRVPSDESSSIVASHDDYPQGHHGRYPPQSGYRNVPAPAPPQSHGGYPPSMMGGPGYADPYAAQALVHMPPPQDPYAYPQPSPFAPPSAQGNPFSPMGSMTGSSSYFASEPLAPPMPHYRPAPMPRPQSYMAPSSHYGSEVMSPYAHPAMSPYAPYGMLPGMPGYPPMPGWYQHPPAPPSAAPSVAKEEKKGEFEALKELFQKQEEARVAREIATMKKLEDEAAAIAVAKAKDEEDKKKKEEIATATKKAKEDAEKKAEETAKKAKDEYEKKMKEAQAARDEAEKKQKAADDEIVKLKPKPDDGKVIKFKDAVGRKFSFPFSLCKTWKGMEALIRQAFLHVDMIGDHVRAGHYDLMGPDNEIILPQVWDTCVQPDWEVSMHMWPMEEKKDDAAMLADPFASLGLADILGDPNKKPKKKESKREKRPNIIGAPGLAMPQGAGMIPPPPPNFPPGFAGILPDPMGGMNLFPGPPPGEVRKDRSKRPGTSSRSKSAKEPGVFASWLAGGSTTSRKKK